MSEFVEGLIKGAKETPVGFFAPGVALWNLLVQTTNNLTGHAQKSDKQKK